MVESSHGSKLFGREVFGIVLSNHTISIGRVSNNDNFNVSSSVIINGFTSVNENFSIIFQQVSSIK